MDQSQELQAFNPSGINSKTFKQKQNDVDNYNQAYFDELMFGSMILIQVKVQMSK